MLEGDQCYGKKGKAEQSQGDWECWARVVIISRVVREGLLHGKFKQMKEEEEVTMKISIILIPVQK